jgi:hypothetical protein
MTPSVRRAPDDARKGRFLAALPDLRQEKRLIAGANQLFSLSMTALVDACGLGYAFMARLPAARAPVRKTLTGTPQAVGVLLSGGRR